MENDPPYVPVATFFEDADTLEFVEADVPTIARQINPRLPLLLNFDREPVGFRIEGWSAIAPNQIAGGRG